MVIDHDIAALAQLQAHGFGVQALRVGHAANGDDELVHFQRLRFALGVGVGNSDAFFAGFDFADFDAQLDFQALFVESLFGFLGHLLVRRAQEGGQPFQNGDFRAQAAPDAAHFQPDDAGADDAEFFGRRAAGFANAQSAVVGEDVFFVKRRAGQLAGAGAGGHDDLLAREGFALVARYGNFVAAVHGLDERAFAVKEADFVLFEQVKDAVVVLFDHAVFAGDHFLDVHFQVFEADAVLAKVMRGLLEMLGALQQRLGRNAAHVGAGASGSGAAFFVFPLVNAGHVQAQLRSANGRDIAAGACADNDDVK